jgi:hypothetical protein
MHDSDEGKLALPTKSHLDHYRIAVGPGGFGENWFRLQPSLAFAVAHEGLINVSQNPMLHLEQILKNDPEANP